MVDPMERLKKIVADTAEVNSGYGGFEVKVIKLNLFSWYKLINYLIEIGRKVWVGKRESKIHII